MVSAMPSVGRAWRRRHKELDLQHGAGIEVHHAWALKPEPFRLEGKVAGVVAVEVLLHHRVEMALRLIRRASPTSMFFYLRRASVMEDPLSVDFSDSEPLSGRHHEDVVTPVRRILQTDPFPGSNARNRHCGSISRVVDSGVANAYRRRDQGALLAAPRSPRRDVHALAIFRHGAAGDLDALLLLQHLGDGVVGEDIWPAYSASMICLMRWRTASAE